MDFKVIQAWQGESLAHAIRESGLEPGAFAPRTADADFAGMDGETDAVWFEPRSFVFAIAEYITTSGRGMGQLIAPGTFTVFYHPGNETIGQVKENLAWRAVVREFRDWLSFIKRELNARTFLEVLQEGSAFEQELLPDGLEFDAADEPFTPAEWKTVSGELDKLQSRIAEMLQAQQGHDAKLSTLEAEIAALKSDARFQGRGRWARSACMHLATTALSQGLSRVEVTQIWGWLVEHLQPVLGSNLLPPGQ